MAIQDTVVVDQSIPPTDRSIGIGHLPKGPPEGYIILPESEKTASISKVARSLLGGDFGTMTPFTINGHRFMARVEPHYHPPPPPEATAEERSRYPKPWGWHKGVTIYKADPAKETIEDYVSRPIDGRMKFLQRIDEFYQQLGVIPK